MWEINGIKTNNEEEVKEFFGMTYLPIVKSLTDSDLYKFSMGETYHNQFGQLQTVWDFKARNVGNDAHEKYTHEDLLEIKRQLKAYCALRLDNDELTYLSTTCPWIKPAYINFLKFWHPEFEDFVIGENNDTGISISFAGVQEYVEYYEIPLLEICAEVYYRNHYDYDKLFEGFKKKNEEKIARMKSEDFHFGTWSEFGARRRLSFEAQDWLIRRLVEEKRKAFVGSNNNTNPFLGFIGTSNIYLAKKYNVKPVGTCAHEFIECVGQGDMSKNPSYSNKFGMEAWVKEYGVWNGIWLTDTIGDELCRRDMKKTYATLFEGVRNDSGDPFIWADNWIKHYEELGIDPRTKTLLFSNSINSLELWDKLCRHVEGKAKPAFGIGTYWSGPQTIEPLNIVAKVVKVNGQDVAKLSDDSGKTMSRSQEYVDYLRRTLDWRLTHQELQTNSF